MWFEKGKNNSNGCLSLLCRHLTDKKSLLFLPKLSNSQINQFSKDWGLSTQLNTSTQLNLRKSLIENHVDNLKLLFNTHY